MREREVISSALAQDFVHLLHQRDERIVECVGREFLVCLPNCLDESFHIFCNNFLLKTIESLKQTKSIYIEIWYLRGLIDELNCQLLAGTRRLEGRIIAGYMR